MRLCSWPHGSPPPAPPCPGPTSCHGGLTSRDSAPASGQLGHHVRETEGQLVRDDSRMRQYQNPANARGLVTAPLPTCSPLPRHLHHVRADPLHRHWPAPGSAARPAALTRRAFIRRLDKSFVRRRSRLLHRDATAALFDRLAHRQSPRRRSLSAAPPRHGVPRPGQPLTFTVCSQHGERRLLEPALPVGTFFAPCCLSVQRQPPRRLSHRLLTHHRLHSSPAFSQP